MIIKLNSEKIRKTVKIRQRNLELQPVNLSETSGDTAGVHQRAAYSLQSF